MLNPFVVIPYHPIVSVGLPLVLGSLSGFKTKDVVRSPWYTDLKEPAFRPPRASFGIVWPILYASMGYASYLISEAGRQPFASAETKKVASVALGLYWAQLGLNLLWTPLFFLYKRTGTALVDIVALTGTVYYLTYEASLLPAPASANWSWLTPALLLAPYCAWLTFATYLNASYWYLNFSPWAKADKGKARAE